MSGLLTCRLVHRGAGFNSNFTWDEPGQSVDRGRVEKWDRELIDSILEHLKTSPENRINVYVRSKPKLDETFPGITSAERAHLRRRHERRLTHQPLRSRRVGRVLCHRYQRERA